MTTTIKGPELIDGNPTHFRLVGYIPHGKGERAVQMFISLKTIQDLVQVMRHTVHPGHAAWHLSRLDYPLGVNCYGCCNGEGAIHAPTDYVQPSQE